MLPPRTAEVLPPPPRRTKRWILILLAVLALFVGLAALALWGLSRAHFVGATQDGRVAVYQGVPWDLVGDVKLYRETYVSRLLTVQLSPSERAELFDHDLTGEQAAIARIRPYEEEATPYARRSGRMRIRLKQAWLHAVVSGTWIRPARSDPARQHLSRRRGRRRRARPARSTGKTMKP